MEAKQRAMLVTVGEAFEGRRGHDGKQCTKRVLDAVQLGELIERAIDRYDASRVNEAASVIRDCVSALEDGMTVSTETRMTVEGALRRLLGEHARPMGVAS